MLLEKGKFFLVRGDYSPAIRLSENATADTIAAVLRNTTSLGSPRPANFERHVVVVESDECPANTRALEILRTPGRSFLHAFCAAHKAHAVANKSWLDHQELHAGLVKTLKVLKGPGVFPRFCDNLLGVLDHAELLVQRPLGSAAIAHRQKVMQTFCPPLSQKPKSAAVIRTLALTLWNGDWQSPIISHHCPGLHCCESHEVMVTKLKLWLPKLLKALRLSTFESGNWSAWQQSLYLLGFLSQCHDMLRKALVPTLQGMEVPLANPSSTASLDDGQDHVDRTGDLARDAKTALAFWTGESSTDELYVFSVSLQPQIKIMEALLGSTRAMCDVEQILHEASGF